ncbi:YhcH/YjgK/YiaL family protein [Klebsiella aerogenes]|uniref:YhcH/YjgK/YiaL family protein n=1 Tax=Klebsiella aerogenes TaxID=548 RepID=UPI00398447F6
MIIGNLNALPQAGLPLALRQILSRPECSLSALTTHEDGRFQPGDGDWYCTIGTAQTQAAEQRHTEYHLQWADIQVILAGEEIIHAGTLYSGQPDDEQRKPDLFISQQTPHSVTLHLRVGDFAVFLPGEPHQALCVVTSPAPVRKAVFKVPRSMLEAP